MSPDTPRRVRVTGGGPEPRPAVRPGPRSHPLRVGEGSDDIDAVYGRALRRTQLRLALGAVAGFVIVTVALTVALTAIPELDHVVIAGVPLSWLVHAFAFYPVIFAFAVLYARGAARNEQRYRALRDRE